MSDRLSVDPAHLSDPAGAAGAAGATDPADHAAALLDRVRASTPLVHCITNSVVTNFTANALLSLGAAPAMVDIRGEAGVFARIASALLVNLGTPDEEQRDAAREAVAAARESGTPWVLDPVAVGGLPVRTALAHELLEHRPAIVRGNASEILALAGEGVGGRGVDATDGPDSAAGAARTLALRTGGVVAVSGAVDLVTDGERIVRIGGGDALLTRVTGGGCSLGAVMAAFLGVCAPLEAAVAASVLYADASERAAAASRGPGSFAVAFLDALDETVAADLDTPIDALAAR